MKIQSLEKLNFLLLGWKTDFSDTISFFLNKAIYSLIKKSWIIILSFFGNDKTKLNILMSIPYNSFNETIFKLYLLHITWTLQRRRNWKQWRLRQEGYFSKAKEFEVPEERVCFCNAVLNWRSNVRNDQKAAHVIEEQWRNSEAATGAGRAQFQSHKAEPRSNNALLTNDV